MAITVTPTLSSTSGWLIDVRDQIANLLRFVIMNPGRTSSLWESDMVSLRVLAATYQNDRSTMCDHFKGGLTRAIRRMFPSYNFNVTITASDYDETIGDDSRYTLAVSITISGLDTDDYDAITPALVSGTISVDSNTNEISLTFNNTVDNALLTTS